MNACNNTHCLHDSRLSAVPAPEPEKVRLLKFVCDFGSGGTEGQVFNLVRRLDSSCFALEFAALHKSGPFVEEYVSRGIAIREFVISSLLSPAACLQMFRLIGHLRKQRIQIMHAYNFYSLTFAIPAARLARVPVVIASIRDRGVYLTKKQKLLQKLVCRMADKILVNAESIRDWLVDQGYQEHKIMVINNGVDLSPFEATSNTAVDASSIRDDWAIQQDSPLVVMLARLNRQKGVTEFIQAAAHVKREYPGVRFLLIGKPSLDSMHANKGEISDHQHWLNLRRELMLEDTVLFCGHRNDIPQILLQAAVSVLPSHSEGLSNSLLESMAAGVPVVATRVGGTPELIQDGVNGILVPAHCPEQLAAGISRLLKNKELARQFGRAGAYRVRERFSIEAMVNRTQEIYTSQLTRREVLS